MQADKSNHSPSPEKKSLFYYYGMVILFMFILNWVIMPLLFGPRAHTTSYSNFLADVNSGMVKKVEISDTEIQYIKEEEGRLVLYKTGVVDNPDLANMLQVQGVDFGAAIPEKPSLFMNILLSWGLPLLLFWGLGSLISRNMKSRMGAQGLQGLQFGGSAGKVYTPDCDKKTFEDVAGQEEAKESLLEIVDYLDHPEKYASIGAKCPKGVLLVGPPGTGKTLIAKAVAGEAGVPFFSISGSEFVEMFVGRGAARVRELFEQASAKAPCIVFIDEIDTIGKRRDAQLGTNDEREQTLNQLLTEMDGFDANKGVIILAATNRPEVLDPALLRPGRFDRQVNMELPDLESRVAILKVHMKNVKMAEEINYSLVARMTAGASGAQLANIVNEAALRAVRMERAGISNEDLRESVETVIAGQQKKNDILSDEEKRIVSYHEIGHALVAAMQSNTAPVQKITIIPRTSGALGYTMQVEETDKVIIDREEVMQRLAILCGGRAAEEIVFNKVTTGAANDIEKATRIARDMVTKYGMSDTFGMMSLSTVNNPYIGGDSTLTVSEATSQRVDEEMLSIIKTAQENARKILMDNRVKLDELAEFLLKKESINGEEFMEVLKR